MNEERKYVIRRLEQLGNLLPRRYPIANALVLRANTCKARRRARIAGQLNKVKR